ncbi:Malonate-semialdehyde dehydrogenase [Ralstonia mannitolilytica]|nr:Malonate-semialdehyde dehydrogenase [Ralstonia mannitolilytica]
MRYAHPGTPGAIVSFKSRYGNYIGGEFVAPVKGQYFTNTTPVTGEVIAEFPRSTAEDVDRALDAAHAAADAWGRTSVQDRSLILLKIADRIEQNLELLAVMINKLCPSVEAALADIPDGATIMIGGFGTAGMPAELIDGLIAQGARELTIINNNAGNGETGLAALLKARRVRKIVCSFPRQADSYVFDALYRAGEIELELVPQGNLAERIRAAGAGIGGFFCPTAYGTQLAEGKETRIIDGKPYVFELPLTADYALIKALRADRWGNLVYRKTARNFGPVMAMAAKCTIAQVSETVELGELDPEHIVTPGIFVKRVVQVAAAQPAKEAA